MPGSDASASNKSDRVLLVGVNWIGDTLMAMPAVQAYRRLHPALHLAVLVKPGLVPLWRMHGAPDEILTYHNGVGAALRASARVRRGRYQRAYVLPHSIRSAIVPFLAGVRDRRGLPGPGRAILLRQIVHPAREPGRRHQGFEYADLLTPELALRLLEPPQIIVPAEARQAALALAGDVPRPWLAVLPGAARGPAKRWPTEHFRAVARCWLDEQRGGVLVLGGADDRATSDELAAALGPQTRSLAGRTDMEIWAALLQASDAAVANDSGGMHLAAALGTPVAAVFGLTDPEQTGPLGRVVRIVQDAGPRSRDLARNSEEAQKRLAAISPERVYQAVLDAAGRASGEHHAS